MTKLIIKASFLSLTILSTFFPIASVLPIENVAIGTFEEDIDGIDVNIDTVNLNTTIKLTKCFGSLNPGPEYAVGETVCGNVSVENIGRKDISNKERVELQLVAKLRNGEEVHNESLILVRKDIKNWSQEFNVSCKTKGTIDVKVIADPRNKISNETNQWNNIASLQVVCEDKPIPMPDIKVEAEVVNYPTNEPRAVFEMGDIPVLVVKLTNIGTKASSACNTLSVIYDHYNLFRNRVTKNIRSLYPNESETFEYPNPCKYPGEYELNAIFSQNSNESDYSNNKATLQYECLESDRLPNIQPEISPSKNIELSPFQKHIPFVKVKNIGDGFADAFQVQHLLTSSQSGIQSTITKISELWPMNYSAKQLNIPIQCGAWEEFLSINASVDIKNNIVETNEDDNSGESGLIHCLGTPLNNYPDIVPYFLINGKKYYGYIDTIYQKIRTELNVGLFVENHSNTASPMFYLSYNYSNGNGGYGFGEPIFSLDGWTENFLGNESYYCSEPGDWYMLELLTDAETKIDELLESNNLVKLRVECVSS
ncbi:MAG: hypothetical protein GYA55_02205 [SAR324 cluster bacterium]|uniref:CARDB domain-containing protein n=1 Tax=SAR324 cluster bacterium TaxID=2024889 RepID=A0A7X9FQD1_9DELT|nr:hypothetical protein [SAR324 cluster bacterium]